MPRPSRGKVKGVCLYMKQENKKFLEERVKKLSQTDKNASMSKVVDSILDRIRARKAA